MQPGGRLTGIQSPQSNETRMALSYAGFPIEMHLHVAAVWFHCAEPHVKFASIQPALRIISNLTSGRTMIE